MKPEILEVNINRTYGNTIFWSHLLCLLDLPLVPILTDAYLAFKLPVFFSGL